MHELPFVIKLLEETDAVARDAGLVSIGRIAVSVGERSGIEPDCVRLYFETAAEGHAAAGAELDIAVRPAEFRCASCGNIWPHDREAARKEGRDPFSCPACGGDGVYIEGTGIGAELASVEGEERNE